MMKRIVYFLFLVLTLSCTSRPELPKDYVDLEVYPFIFPDYTNVTVPSNIAPLTFMTTDTVSAGIIAEVVDARGKHFVYGVDKTIIIPQDEWAEMKATSKGKDLEITIFSVHKTSGEWARFMPFHIHIAPEEIDEYISYRLIEPSYMLYNKMSIVQRQLSSYEETEIYNNQVSGAGGKGQCINCHSYQNYSTDNMLFHVRVTDGGTVIVVDGKPKKVNLKRPYTISAGVYPAWHPTEQLIAFSTNNTSQWFHTFDRNKVEVFDNESDLILYDIARDSVSVIANDSTRLEVFPTWTPDGKYLYYCSADSWKNDSTDFRTDYVNLHYNIYRKSFDAKTLSFGEEELVYVCDSIGKSASLPRISPDGRYLAFAEGPYGCFNIWHHEADIKVLDLNKLEQATSPSLDNNASIDATGINSKWYAESYPSWSSNGKWLMCASRRDDGNYSRIYISYFDGDSIHKAFEIPQDNPRHNTLRLKSYNRPEFMKEPVRVSIQDFAKIVKGE